MKLASKLAIVFVLLSTLPLALIGFLAYSEAKDMVENQTFHQLTSTNLLKEREFERWLNDNLQSLKLLAQRPLVIARTNDLIEFSRTSGLLRDPEILHVQPAYLDLLKDHMMALNEVLGGFESLSIIQADNGMILISTKSSLEGKFRESDKYFLEGKERSYIDEVAYWPSSGEIALHMSTPIVDPAGNIIAVLVGQADLSEMSSIIARGNSLASSENSYLVNIFNFFITEPRFGKNFALTRTVHSEGVDACLTGTSGTGIYRDYRGAIALGAYEWLPQYKLCMVTEIDRTEAFAPIRQAQLTMLGIGLFVALGAALVGYYFSRTLTRSLRTLEHSAKLIGKGVLGQKIDISSSDEIGSLAATLNEMTANLSTSIEMVDYGRKLMGALNTAGINLQRIRDESVIYASIASTIKDLDYEAVLMQLSEDGHELVVNQITIESKLLSAAERFAGISAIGYRLPVSGDNHFTQAMRTRKPIFISDMSLSLAQTFSHLGTGIVRQIVKLLRSPTGIYAPIATEESTYGLMIVMGEGLSEYDLPVVGTFANQVANALENARLYKDMANWTGELEQRVAERTALLERSNQELEQFAYVASHDLQEPLRSIAGFLQLLERRSGPALDNEGKEFIDRAVNAAQRMKTLISDLLQFSRVGTRGRDPEPVNSAGCVENALRSLQNSIETTGAEIVIKDHLPTVLADESQLTQLFQNLIGNAIKFHGEAQPRVRIEAVPEDGRWKFSVSDNGVGIKEEYFERVFQVFQRLHGREAYEGTGIGLAIAKKIVERHGGRIWIVSEPGKGATFNFTLPTTKESV